MQLLTSQNHKNHFLSSDSRELYTRNLRSQPRDWYWRINRITYTMNSQYYRAPEWDQISWNRSNLIFGCSMVFGLGVGDQHTLAQNLGPDWINLGYTGASSELLMINTIKLLAEPIKPLRVVYVWPTADRFILLHPQPIKPSNLGVWDVQGREPHKRQLWDLLTQHWPQHLNQKLPLYRAAVDLMWAARAVPVSHFSWDHTVTDLDPDNIKYVDFNTDQTLTARDTMHPGPASIRAAAEQILSKL